MMMMLACVTMDCKHAYACSGIKGTQSRLLLHPCG
jgi:hypothetical protein